MADQSNQLQVAAGGMSSLKVLDHPLSVEEELQSLAETVELALLEEEERTEVEQEDSMAGPLLHRCRVRERQRVYSPVSEVDHCPSGRPAADHQWRKVEDGSSTYPRVHHQAVAAVAEIEAGAREEVAVGKRRSQ